MNCLVIFIKYPEPGKVKTRLGAELGFELAADLYRLFIEQTLEIARKSLLRKIFVAYEPKERKNEFREIIPSSFDFFAQRGETLGDRMRNAIDYVLNKSAENVVILGSDSPTLPSEFLGRAFRALNTRDLVLGPSEDGGYYLIGMKYVYQELFEDIEWSSSSVLQTTVDRAKELRLNYQLLPTWYDVDDKQTLIRSAEDDQSGKIRSFLDQRSKVR